MDYYKCRLCLEETTQYEDIFQDTFPDMVLLLSGIKVDPEDGLPTKSCLQCYKEVKSAMLTRYQIINSHSMLLDELKVKKEQIIEQDLCIYQDRLVEKNKANNEGIDSDGQQIPHEDKNDIKKDETQDDCYDSLDNFSCEENDGSNHTLINYESLEKDIKSDIKGSSKSEKTDTITKHSIRKDANREIKFRKKKINREKLPEDRIEFKRKKSVGSHYLVKVQYEIKPEHQEFLKTVGRKDRVPCPDCKRVMFGMNMKNHLITHNYDPVICDICGKTSKNAQALQDHINYYHKTTPDRFMCDKCGKGYRVRFMLERHEKKEHGNGEKDYECSICGKKFFEKLHLKNHINITHKKIKAYKCEHCGKDFGRRTQFVTHQLVHTKENRYHCQVCGKGFKIKQTMQTHLKGVHGIEEEKTIFCKICQKGFSSLQGLRAHVNSRVHGLEKCEHCSEFITVEYKSIHLRDIHGIHTETAYS